MKQIIHTTTLLCLLIVGLSSCSQKVVQTGNNTASATNTGSTSTTGNSNNTTTTSSATLSNTKPDKNVKEIKSKGNNPDKVATFKVSL